MNARAFRFVSMLTTAMMLWFSFVSLRCKDDGITPPPDDRPTNCTYPPGNRNFTWRVDTVAWWPSTLGGVWAFSDTDAWVMGDMSGPVINGQNTSYVGLHWNGKSWNEKIDFLDILMKANDVTGDDHFMVAAGYRLFIGEKPAIAEFDNRTKRWKGYQFETAGELRAVWTDGEGFYIAVGDNGMVYTKDSYAASWIYSKIPSDFNFLRIAGVSKTETYAIGYRNLAVGESYDQIWKYEGSVWTKLFDTQDTTRVLPLTKDDYVADIAPLRCRITDSLLLYVIGNDSYVFHSNGQQLQFSKTNLATLGLPLKSNGRSGLDINAYSPNDYWVFGTRYNFHHWNGSSFQKVVIPGLPNDDMRFGDQRRMVKTKSGKVFLPTEVSSQVYVVVQGTQ